MELKKAGLILLLGVIATKVEGTLFKLILINKLDPAFYGKFSIFLILFNWLLLIATFNITIGLAKFVAENKRNRKSLYTAALVGCTIISLLVSLILVLFRTYISSFINLNDDQIILFLAAVLPFSTIYNLTIFYFRGLYKMKSSAFSDIFLAVIRIVVLILMLYLGFLYAPYIAFLLSFIILDFVLLFLQMKSSFNVQFKNIFNTFKQIFYYSLPIFLSESFRLFGMGLDRLFLAKYYTTFAAGIYDVASTLCLGYILIGNSYANALLPIASKNHRDHSMLKVSLVKTFWYVFGFYIIYTIIILLLAEPLITVINPNYLPLFNFLGPLMIAYAMMGLLSLLSHFVNAINLQRYAVISSALFVFVCFASNFYFVPKLMYLGAVNAMLISSVVSMTLLTVLVWRRLKLKK